MEPENCDPVMAGSIQMGCLIWAEDLLLLSKSEVGLKNMLSALKLYSTKNGLTLNIKKKKTGRHIRRNFYFGNSKLETTRQYKYLGFMITPSGEISTGLKDLEIEH